MTVRLRPHHLLCILTYVGEGYSKAFTRNYDAIVHRLRAGEAVDIVEGADDICAPRLSGEHHCFDESITRRDRLAEAELSALLGGDLASGAALDRTLTERLRQAFAAGTIRRACAGCEWHGLCDRVAETGFSGVRF